MIIKLSPQDIRRYNWYMWRTVIGIIAFFILLIAVTDFGLFGSLPTFRDLENPKSNQATEVIGDDGSTVLGTYFVQNRSNVTFSQLSPNVVNALVATEDSRFYEHSGIDFRRMATIPVLNLFKKQGGSTITQQLAKNMFHGEGARNPLVRFTQKLKEWIIAVRLERRYTKQEIITMYLNKVSFGAYNTYGIKSAAHTYFNETPDKLTPDQAAVLVGMVKGPTIYSPIRHPDRSLARRNLILGLMQEQGYLTEGQLATLRAKPLGLDFSPMSHVDGPAPYFRAVLKKEIEHIFKTQNITKSDGTPYDLDRDGLKVYTTIDPTMQQYAEEAQAEYMPKLQDQFNQQWHGVSRYKNVKNFKLLLDQGMYRSDRYKQLELEGKSEAEIRQNFDTPDSLTLFTWRGDIDTVMKPIDSIVFTKMMLRNAMMSMDPTTGYIKAWVGGTNFEHFKYDQVKEGTRQVGSTAKPFTYAVAIENGFSPCQEVDNVPITIYGYGPPWTPGSSPTETLQGAITLRQALAHSQNWVTAYVMNEVKPEPVVELIKKMGINSDVPPYPSICLGVFNASVFDMTGAYCVFANHGIWTEPTFILRIEDKNGNVIYSHTPRVVQAMDAQSAYVMNYMLKGVIEDGTGSRLQRPPYSLTNPIAGKTGTTQDNSDGWFIGDTPQLVTGVWTGCEDRDIHFRSTRLGEGANTALPIFALYMKKVYANAALGIKKNVDFDPPKNGVNVILDCDQYKQQQQGTGEVDKKLGF